MGVKRFFKDQRAHPEPGGFERHAPRTPHHAKPEVFNMGSKLDRRQRRKKKHRRVRKKVSGRPNCPRLCVFKSGRHIYAQLIDDFTNNTITGVSSLTPEIRKDYDRGNQEAAQAVGELIAKKADEHDIEQVVFDRGGYRYHGKVKALAEGAREGGLEF